MSTIKVSLPRYDYVSDDLLPNENEGSIEIKKELLAKLIIRWASGGGAVVVVFFEEPQPAKMTTEIINANTFFIQIVLIKESL